MTGAIDRPHWPVSSVVTPCVVLKRCASSEPRMRSPWEWASHPAGADVLAAGVDDSGGFLTAVCHDQLSAGNTDAALIGRLSGAIDDIRILDQHIQHIICSFPFCSFSLNELLSSIGININVFSVSVNGKPAFSNAFSAFSSIFTKAGSRF
ncbi:MAG: hypothetical protein ACLTGJ_04085 [Faecalibacterium prausnitzii]